MTVAEGRVPRVLAARSRRRGSSAQRETSADGEARRVRWRSQVRAGRSRPTCDGRVRVDRRRNQRAGEVAQSNTHVAVAIGTV